MGTLRNTVLVFALLGGARAHAETDIEQADKLFAEGLALRETNRGQSCEKFRQSLEKNPQAIGTLLNVALCDEETGRLATAVKRFAEARDRAKEGNLPEYLDEAERKLAALTPELPYVSIRFTAKAPDTRVLLNDRVIADGELGGEIPVDPGELVVVVSAPGRVAYETKILIAKREKKPIDVPELEHAVTVKTTRRTGGIITTASGGAVLATGIILGLVARNEYNDTIGGCPEKVCQTEEAQRKIDDARRLGLYGTLVGGVGVVAIGVGVYLWLSAPKETAQANVSVVPTLSPESAGFAAIGRF